MAYGRGRHGTEKTAVSNKQMGELRIAAWLTTYPDKTREEAVVALTAMQTTTKVIQSLKSSSRGLMALLCSSIQEELLLKLMEDQEFEKARKGTCVVTLIEAIQNRAANATQVSRIDRKEAERIFNEFRMSGRDYLKFKKQMNLNHINALRAGCEISGQDAVGTIVANLSAEVFPTLHKELLRKETAWKDVKDLTAMWKLIDAEYQVFLAINLDRDPDTKLEESTSRRA